MTTWDTTHPDPLRPAHTPEPEPPKSGGRDSNYTGENGKDWKGKWSEPGIEEEVKVNNCSVGFSYLLVFNYFEMNVSMAPHYQRRNLD